MPAQKNSTIRIGTRGSKLALWQASHVAGLIKKHWPKIFIHLVPIKTSGDSLLDGSLAKMGGKGLFIKEIEEALLLGKIDLAVHSMKDMPAIIPKELVIAAILLREDPRDVFISSDSFCFEELKPGSTIGTSSLRRICQLKTRRQDLVYWEMRGNVDTRLEKLKAGKVDAVVLAAAGLKRLGFEKRITEYLDTVPAVGQGAIGIEINRANKDLARLLVPLNDGSTQTCVEAERVFLKIMEGNCQIPLGCHVVLENSKAHIRAFISDPQACQMLYRDLTVDGSHPIKEVEVLAHQMLNEGGREIFPGTSKNWSF